MFCDNGDRSDGIGEREEGDVYRGEREEGEVYRGERERRERCTGERERGGV